MTIVEHARCPATWPILVPNAEDQRFNRVHACRRLAQHEPPCRCVCGDELASEADR